MRRFVPLVATLLFAACGSAPPTGGDSSSRAPTSTGGSAGAPSTDAGSVADGAASPGVDAAIATRDASTGVGADLAPADLASSIDLASSASVDLASSSVPDLATLGGPGAPCATSCQCDPSQDLVCFLGACRDSTLVNAGHPVTQAFDCCDVVRARGQCTARGGCQSADGTIGPCAGSCSSVACGSNVDCANAGCATACSPTTHLCQ